MIGTAVGDWTNYQATRKEREETNPPHQSLCPSANKCPPKGSTAPGATPNTPAPQSMERPRQRGVTRAATRSNCVPRRSPNQCRTCPKVRHPSNRTPRKTTAGAETTPQPKLSRKKDSRGAAGPPLVIGRTAKQQGKKGKRQTQQPAPATQPDHSNRTPVHPAEGPKKEVPNRAATCCKPCRKVLQTSATERTTKQDSREKPRWQTPHNCIGTSRARLPQQMPPEAAQTPNEPRKRN